MLGNSAGWWSAETELAMIMVGRKPASRFTALSLLMPLAFLGPGCGGQSPEQNVISAGPDVPLNVLFIVADDLNCALGAYGDSLAQTPNLDRLAAEGTVFTNAHCQYPLCGPSRASFMTGLYADQTHIKKNNIYLRSALPDVVTLSQRFRQRGYQAVRIGKIFHYDNPGTIGTAGIDDRHSWDQTVNPYGRDKREEHKINTLKPRRYGGTLSWLASEGEDEEQTDGIGATEAVEHLQAFSASGDPFFLAVGFYRPHTPFVAPVHYFDKFDRDEMDIPSNSDSLLSGIPVPAQKSVRAQKTQIHLAEEVSKEIKEAYYATVSFVDAQVGRVLDALDNTGLAENTLVVFISDHGYHLGEHGHWQKQTLFDEATRVPLIIRSPGRKERVRSTSIPVELVDLYPTILDFAEISKPDFLSGVSLRGAMENQQVPMRGSALTVWRQGRSIATDRFRLTEWGPSGEKGYELYDHHQDAAEMNNLAADPSHSRVLDSLKSVLQARWSASLLKPPGAGRLIERPPVAQKTPNITFGDRYNIDGSPEVQERDDR